MPINPIQQNIENTKPYKTYRDAQDSIKTDTYVKPLPPQGHLVHDTILSLPKFWIKDIEYDLKAVRDGFRGTANDHQSGRLNDVGLKLGGIGIATILAANTKNPMARAMEYVGLGSFLAAMSLYPKLAINLPSKIAHGFDIGKEYIDDQGRKKSVFQDSNYIPFDMYDGKSPEEDLDVIGDRLGIPRDIKNRHDLIKEQMRKIATQNNTLWMLTAGFATPVMTALICTGLEKIIAPAIENARNSKYNSAIEKALKNTENMTLDLEEIPENKLSKNINDILLKYKNKEIPQTEIDNIIKLLSDQTDSKISEGIKEDITKILQSTKHGYSINESCFEDIQNTIKMNIPAKNKTTLEKTIIPTEIELQNIFSKINSNSKEITADEISALKRELKNLFVDKIEKDSTITNKEYYKGEARRVIDKLSITLKTKPAHMVTEENLKEIVDFAKVIEEFKTNHKIIDSSKNFKVEYFSETVLARSYAKFEKTLLDVLNIKYKELKLLREPSEAAQKLIEEKIETLVKDRAKYEKAIKKLSDVIIENDKILNSERNTVILRELINAIENNYNNTAKRISNIGKGKFSYTIDKLVKNDYTNSFTSEKDLINLLDGNIQSKNLKGIDYVKETAKGVGSSKRDQITKIIDRYQGATNSFNRVLHTLDFYRKQEVKPEVEKYGEELARKSKDTLLKATSAEHIQKLYTINNPLYYQDLMKKIYSTDVDELTKNALSENYLSRFKNYIEKFKDLFGSNSVDFQKPNHRIGDASKYSQDAKTRLSHFNLLGQSPIDMIKGAANRKYSSQRWLRVALSIFGTVLGTALLAQFSFGKIKNPHNIQKQVNNDTNS